MRAAAIAMALLVVGTRAEAQSRTPTVAVLSPDAARVAAQENGTIRIWERASGKLLASFKSAGMFRGALGLDTLAGVVGDERVALWRAPKFKPSLDQKHEPKVLSLGRVYLAANGSTYCTVFAKDGGVGDPNAIRVWTAGGKLLGSLSLEEGRIQGIALSPDGQRLAIFGDVPGAKEGALLELYRVDRRGRKLTRLLKWRSPDPTTYSAAFSPDGKQLALGAGSRLLLFEVGTPAATRLLGAAETGALKMLFPPQLRGPSVMLSGAHQIAFAPDGKRLATVHALGVVGVGLWELSLGKPSRANPLLKPLRWVKRPTQGTLRQLAFDSKGGIWLITASYVPEVWVFEAEGDRFVLRKTLTP